MLKTFTAVALLIAANCSIASAQFGGRYSLLPASRGYDQSNLYMQVEATFLAPLVDDAGGSFSVQDLAGANAVAGTLSNESVEELAGAPRITLGYRGYQDWGIQFRYWEMDAYNSSSNLPAPALGVANASLVGGAASFEAYTIDLELTRDFCCRNADMLATFGVRHAYLREGTQSNNYGVVANGGVVDAFNLSSFAGTQAKGTGLTGSLSSLKPLCRDRSISLFTSGRGSVLFGDAGARAESSSLFTGTAGQGGSVNVAQAGVDDALFIGEIQAGLQYSRCISTFNARMFARAAFEYQYWNGDDGSALAVSTSGTGGQSLGTATASASDFNNHLIGFSLGTGFVW